MSNNKQSSVEWFAKESSNLELKMQNKEITFGEYSVVYALLIEQAKEMHKEEITDAWNDGAYGGGQFTTTHDTSEQYYNETFGGNDE